MGTCYLEYKVIIFVLCLVLFLQLRRPFFEAFSAPPTNTDDMLLTMSSSGNVGILHVNTIYADMAREVNHAYETANGNMSRGANSKLESFKHNSTAKLASDLAGKEITLTQDAAKMYADLVAQVYPHDVKVTLFTGRYLNESDDQVVVGEGDHNVDLERFKSLKTGSYMVRIWRTNDFTGSSWTVPPGSCLRLVQQMMNGPIGSMRVRHMMKGIKSLDS